MTRHGERLVFLFFNQIITERDWGGGGAEARPLESWLWNTDIVVSRIVSAKEEEECRAAAANVTFYYCALSYQ
jgi:hypothetical protein